jgi:hypothetical protein
MNIHSQHLIFLTDLALQAHHNESGSRRCWRYVGAQILCPLCPLILGSLLLVFLTLCGRKSLSFATGLNSSFFVLIVYENAMLGSWVYPARSIIPCITYAIATRLNARDWLDTTRQTIIDVPLGGITSPPSQGMDGRSELVFRIDPKQRQEQSTVSS